METGTEPFPEMIDDLHYDYGGISLIRESSLRKLATRSAAFSESVDLGYTTQSPGGPREGGRGLTHEYEGHLYRQWRG